MINLLATLQILTCDGKVVFMILIKYFSYLTYSTCTCMIIMRRQAASAEQLFSAHAHLVSIKLAIDVALL